MAARPGLRVAGAWDGFELAVRALLGQQITVAGAVRLAARLVAAFGEPVSCANGAAHGLTHVFPSPERLADRDLSCLGLHPVAGRGPRAPWRERCATRRTSSGPGAASTSTIRTLRTLPGVGEWTAQYIAMREMREPDAFPAADVGLLRAMADGHGRRPSARELLARAEQWRPWRAYAAQHLWASG